MLVFTAGVRIVWAAPLGLPTAIPCSVRPITGSAWPHSSLCAMCRLSDHLGPAGAQFSLCLLAPLFSPEQLSLVGYFPWTQHFAQYWLWAELALLRRGGARASGPLPHHPGTGGLSGGFLSVLAVESW